MNNIISVRNNQAFLKEYSQQTIVLLNTISEWCNRDISIIRVLDYIIKNISIYGVNSHPSQTTIGKHAGIKRGWTNVLTNKLVDMGLITKTRVIINGDEQACEYALTPLLKDRNIGWMLKDVLPALKLLYLFRKTKAAIKSDCTPYIGIYIKEFTKIVITGLKSISRKQKSKINKMHDRINQQTIQEERIITQSRENYYELRQKLAVEQYKKELEEKLLAASKNQDTVNFIQGLFSANI